MERHHFEGGHQYLRLAKTNIMTTSSVLCVIKVLEFNDEVIEAHSKSKPQSLGFILTDHALHLYGICSNQAKKSQSPYK